MEDGLVWDSVDHKYSYRRPYDGPMGIFEDYDEEDDDPRRYMGSDSDFSDHALGIDY